MARITGSVKNWSKRNHKGVAQIAVAIDVAGNPGKGATIYLTDQDTGGRGGLALHLTAEAANNLARALTEETLSAMDPDQWPWWMAPAITTDQPE